MKLVDIHTHKDSLNNEVISIRNHVSGVEKIRSNFPFSIGLHPWFLNVDIGILKEQARLNQNNPHWKALGECGLDFLPENLQKFNKNKQEEVFIEQIKLAGKYRKSLIIHCVKCFDRLLKIKKENDNNQIWIVHGFSKNKALSKQLLDAGFYLSFGAQLLKSKSNLDAFLYTPIERIFLETDNQTQYDIKSIYEFATQVKNVSLQKIKEQIFNNYNTIL